MGFFRNWAQTLGLVKTKIPEKTPHIAIYSLMILDGLVQKSSTLADVKRAIEIYPEDTHNQGHVCRDMANFVAVFATFEYLINGIEQQFAENGGRRGVESQRDSMEKLESWYDW